MRPVVVAIVALISCPAIAQEPAAQQPLNLTCFGGGTANKVSVGTVHSNTQISGMVGTTIVTGTGSGTGTVSIPRHEAFTDQVDVRLFNGDDRIRLPGTTIPTFHGGDGGWFKLKKVVVDARSIHAEAAVNFINHPRVYIDRVTGTISISGRSGDYSGECQVTDSNAPAKF